MERVGVAPRVVRNRNRVKLHPAAANVRTPDCRTSMAPTLRDFRITRQCGRNNRGAPVARRPNSGKGLGAYRKAPRRGT